MMKRGAYIIILYLILLLCVKEIRGDGEEDEEDGTMVNIDTTFNNCQNNATCQGELEKLSDTHSDLEKLKEGITIGKEIGDLLKKAVNKGQIGAFGTQITQIANRFSKALPVIGPIVALVTGFFPSVESQQITQLRLAVQTGFSVVNNKLDDVMHKIDRVEIICKSVTFITKIEDDKEKIINARSNVREWIETSEDEEQLQAYTSEVIRLDGGGIIDAATNLKNTLLDGEFAKTIIEAENSNRESINDKRKQMYMLIFAGVETYLMWMKINGLRNEPDFNDNYINNKMQVWNQTLQHIGKEMIKFDQETFTNNWMVNYCSDYKRMTEEGGTAQALVERIYSFLQGKYDWLNTFVMVYENPGRWNETRYWANCVPNTSSKVLDSGRTVFVGWRSKTLKFDKVRAQHDLNNFRHIIGWEFTIQKALRLFNTNNNTVGLCNDFLIKGVVKSNINLHIRSATKYARKTNIGMWDFFKI